MLSCSSVVFRKLLKMQRGSLARSSRRSSLSRLRHHSLRFDRSRRMYSKEVSTVTRMRTALMYIVVWHCLIVPWTDQAGVVDDAMFAYARKKYTCCIGSTHVLHCLVLACGAGRPVGCG